MSQTRLKTPRYKICAQSACNYFQAQNRNSSHPCLIRFEVSCRHGDIVWSLLIIVPFEAYIHINECYFVLFNKLYRARTFFDALCHGRSFSNYMYGRSRTRVSSGRSRIGANQSYLSGMRLLVAILQKSLCSGQCFT